MNRTSYEAFVSDAPPSTIHVEYGRENGRIVYFVVFSEDVETDFVESVDALERRIAADLQQGRDGATDDATTDGGYED